MEIVERKTKYSIVCPVYKNFEVLEELHARLVKALEPLTLDFELLFINDACPQGSLEVLRKLAENDSRVAVISLVRNCGQQRAIMLGLAHAGGDVIVTMDSDLQDPPEAIPSLLDSINHQYPVVFAGRRGHYESSGRLFTSRIYKSILHWLTGIPTDAGLFLAMERQVAQAVLTIQDADPYLVAMIGCTDYPSRSIPVERNRREAGQSTYNSWGRIKSGLGAIRWVITSKLGMKPARNPNPAVDSRIGEFIGKRFTIGSETIQE